MVIAPQTARAATWSAAQAIFQTISGSGGSNTAAKARLRPAPKAAPKILATNLSVYQPTSFAVHTIPSNYLNLCLKWGAATKVDWRMGCATLWEETNFGRDGLPGVTSGINAFGCCRGPGQFNTENGSGARIYVTLPHNHSYSYFPNSTWAHRKIDGNHDGVYDIFDPEDAIPSTFYFLASAGATTRAGWQGALWHYNQLTSYALAIMARAQLYGVTSRGIS